MESHIKTPAELSATFQHTMDEFIALFSAFSDKQINTVLYEGSWTPGQVGEHVRKVTTGFNEMLNGPVENTTRPYEEQAAQIKADFLNFDIKMDSPDFVVPEEKQYSKVELLPILKDVTAEIVASIKTLDLGKTCTMFKPGPDWLTRYEAVAFVTYHNRRHVFQLNKLHGKFAVKATNADPVSA